MAAVGQPAAGPAMAAFVLVMAMAVCAIVILAGAPASEALLGLFGQAGQDSAALVDTIYTIVLFGALLIAGIIGGRLSNVKPLAMGPRPRAGSMLGLLIGFGGVLAAAGYAWVAGTLAQAPGQLSGALFLWGSLLVLLQAGSEEVYFRGWLQPVLARSWGPVAAVLLSAAAFALLHIIGGARSPLTIVNLFLGGLLFALLTQYRGGIAAAVAAHFAWNWTEQMLLGLMPNPGISSFGALVNLELAGATLWGGGEEGLNASAAMTLVLSAMVVPLLVLAARRQGAVTPPAALVPDRSGPAPA